MTLRFLGRDPNSADGNSPTLWETETSYIVQGWKIVEPCVLDEIGDVPEHETVVEIPKHMTLFLPEVTGGGTHHG